MKYTAILALLLLSCSTTLQEARTPQEQANACADIESRRQWSDRYAYVGDDVAEGSWDRQLEEWSEFYGCARAH